MLKYAIYPLILIVLMFSAYFLWDNYAQRSDKHDPITNTVQAPLESQKAKIEGAKIKVTFIELGSLKCVPCKMMQPIMDEIAKDYKGQVEVVFYDVWTPEGRPYANKYQIRAIPTQVFLDKNGNEYYRHLGFFPKEELIKVLRLKGIQ